MTTPKTEIRVSADLISAPRSAVARRVAWTLWAAALVLAAVAIVLVIGTLSTPAPQAGFVRGSNALFAVAWATIGARIAARHPRNAVGWLLLTTGITFGFAAVIVEAIIARSFGADFVDAGIRLNQVLSFILPLTAGLTVLLFPDGRLASPAWLPVLVLLVASQALGAGVAVFTPLPTVSSSPNPFLAGLNALLEVDLFRLASVGSVLSLAGCAVALLYRLGRASGSERQQLKWVAAGGALAVVTYLAANALPGAPLLVFIHLLSLLFFPIAIGIAMLRYRLYEIDVILNRALVYLIVTALLAGFTAALLGSIQRVFIAATGQSSEAALVITTVLLVAVFTPLRELVQRFIDARVKSPSAGLTGLGSFASEVRRYAGLSDPDRLVERLVSESVASLGAVGGAAEIRAIDGTWSVHPVGRWSGDSHISATISDDHGAAARVRLGPRYNAEAYSKHHIAQLREAIDAVAEAFDAPLGRR